MSSTTDSFRVHRTRLRSVGAHLALQGIAALLLGLAFPAPGWGWLAHIALVPAVLAALRSMSPWRLAWTGFLVAWAWWLLMIRWMIPVTFGGYVAVAALLALYWPATLLLVRWLGHRWRSAMVLTLPMAWVSLEWIRGCFLSGGWGWFTLAHSQMPYLPGQAPSRLAQTADLFGEPAVSFLVAMTNGLILDLLTRRWVRPAAEGGARLGRTVTAATVVWALALGGAWIYGTYRLRQTVQTTSPGPRIALIQTNVPQDNKNNPTTEQEQRDWARMLDLTRQASAAKPTPDLIVWPETMVPASLNPESIEHYRIALSGVRGNQRYHEAIASLASELHTHLLVGASTAFDWTIVTSPDGQTQFEMPRRRYNSAYLYAPTGTQSQHRYDKVHRVPFGEYIPWVEQWPALKRWFLRTFSPYDFDYTLQPGRSFTAFPLPLRVAVPATSTSTHPAPQAMTKEIHLAAPICFEDTVWRVTRRMIYSPGGHKRADLLVNLTNDGWFAGTFQPTQHFQIATLRCIENRVPMARSVNTGITGFIDSAGRVGPVLDVAGKSQNVDGFVIHTVALDARATLFGRLGQSPVIALALATLLLALAGFLRRPSAEL